MLLQMDVREGGLYWSEKILEGMLLKRTLQEIVDKLTGMDDIFFHKLAQDKDFCEELL